MEEIRVNQTDEIIYKEVLPNGLSIYLYPNKNVEDFFISLCVRFGNKDTKFKFKDSDEYVEIPNGLAHFLEHITFHLDGIDAKDLFKPYGSYINASTSYERTAYIVQNNQLFNENLSTLLSYVYTPYYTDKTVENEKGIIKEEAKMCADDPGRVFYFNVMKSLFSKSKVRNEIVGTLDEIDSITLKNIEDAYHYFYHPANMYLTIAGNFDKDEAIETIKETMDKFTFDKYREIEVYQDDEPVKVNKEFHKEKGNSLTTKVNYSIKVPMKNFECTNLPIEDVYTYINCILDANLSSTSLYYEELMNNNIIQHPSSAYVEIIDDYFIITVANEPNEGKVDEFLKITEKYINNLELDEKVIKRKIKVETSEYILSYDNIRSVVGRIQSNLIDFRRFRNNYLDVVKSIDINTCKKVLECIDFNNKTIVILEPKNK